MAKESMKAREVKRAKLVARYAEKRAALKKVIATSEDPAEAYEAARWMGKKEGLLVGISSGAALSAAINLAKKVENKGKTIVVLLPDTGDRYLSTNVF